MNRIIFLLAFSVAFTLSKSQTPDQKPFKILKKHDGGITALAFSPDGKVLVTGSEDKTLLIWNTATWECSRPLTGHTQAVNSVSFLASGTRFYSGGDYYVRSWNLKGDALDAYRGPTTHIWSVALKPDSSQWVAGSFEKNIKLFDYKTTKVSNIGGHTKSALAVAYSPDGKLMASGSLDENIFIRNTSDYKIIDTLKGHSGNIFSLTFSPDGKYLASASNDQDVRVWDVSQGKLLQTFRGHTGAVFSVAFSADGSYLASGSADSNVLIWESAMAKT
ncbi:MAG: WD40 repeat domain-containing protein, partial [Bacteroidales bacterium]|nr:WD40 repeat domain-containing protein [Bacteroidales bacterium]